MAQISYGTITITDTTDIERIYPVYCKGDETNTPSLQPLTDWSENVSQAGGSGNYIWQRIVTKKQGVAVTANDYSDAVRLTGDDGVSLTITSIQYAQTQNENDIPSYGNSMPSSINEGWWLWVKTTYSDGQSSVTKVKQGQKGDTGQRGTSILKVTTAPSVYTTTQGGFTPSYRLSLSTIKTESGKTEVLVGDIIEYNSNHYRVGYVSSSYVYLSAATSIKGADGQTYYTHILYSSKASPTSSSDVSTSPSGKSYVGVQTTTNQNAPAWNDSNWTWMKYIGTDGVSVTQVRELYYLTTGNAPNKPTSSTTIYSDDRVGAWTSVVPAYIVNGKYYVSLETTLSDNTKVWSNVVLDQALTDANHNAYEALSQATAANAATALLGGHFIYGDAITGTSTPASARIVEQIKENSVDVSAIPSKWHHNVIIGANGINLRYNEAVIAQLAANQSGNNTALKFFKPPIISGNTTTQGALAMELNSSALNFYGSSTSTADVSLTSNGLNITNGSIQLGSGGSGGISSGNITLSNVDFDRSINGTPRSNLRLAIGQYFGVKNDGTLYASNAVISGAITVSDTTNSNVYTTTATDGLLNTKALNSAEYSVEIEVKEINYVSGKLVLEAHVYKLGVRQIGTNLNGISFEWSYIKYDSNTGDDTETTLTTSSIYNTQTITINSNAELEATYVCTISKT